MHASTREIKKQKSEPGYFTFLIRRARIFRPAVELERKNLGSHHFVFFICSPAPNLKPEK